MKKLYSKKLGGEAFALDAAQLDTLKKAGYTVPSPEEVIADAAAVKIEPPEGKRAYVVFDFKTGAFKVRTRTQTLAESEVGGFVGEVVSAAILCRAGGYGQAESGCSGDSDDGLPAREYAPRRFPTSGEQ